MNDQKINGTKVILDLETVDEAKVLRIPLSLIRFYANQPRGFFNPVSLQELAGSIRETGQVSPGIVKKLNPPDGQYEFELVDGERRIRACLMAGVAFFRAVLESIGNEKDQFEKSAIANFCREEHPPLEVARMIQRFKSEEYGYTNEKIAARLGRSRAYVEQYYSLLRLNPDVLKLLDPALPSESQLGVTTALKLLKLDPADQVMYARKITGERMGLGKARHMIDKAIRQTGKVAPRRPDKEFDFLAGFVDRTRDSLGLFSEISKADLEKALNGRGLQDRMAFSENLDTLIIHANALKAKVDAILQTPK